MTAAQQQAFEEATDVVMAYRQTLVDLYSGARTNLNDLNAVATGKVLDDALTGTSKGISKGDRVEPRGAQLVLVSAQPVKVNLEKNPNAVVVQVCLDGSAATSIAADSTRTPGGREVLDYTVTRTKYLPAPGWAVSNVMGDSKDRTC